MDLARALSRLTNLSEPVVRSVTVAFAACLSESALVPLLPMIRHRAALGALAVAVLVALPTAVMLVAAIPIGALARRLGSDRIVLAAAVAAPAGLLFGAIAPTSYTALVGSRVLSGIASAALWTIAPATISRSERRAAGMSALIAIAGLGWLVGPAVAGLVADAAGMRSAMVALALAGAPGILLAASGRKSAGSEAQQARDAWLRPALEAALRDPAVRGGVLGMVVLGIAAGATSLLAPFALDRDHLSAGAIGACFAAAAFVWIGWAWLAGRARDTRVGVRAVAVAGATVAIAWLIPVTTTSAAAIVVLLLLSGTGRALLNTWVYVLASNGRSGGEHAHAIAALMNAVWAVAALGTPLALGPVIDHHLTLAFAGTGTVLAAIVAAIVAGRAT